MNKYEDIKLSKLFISWKITNFIQELRHWFCSSVVTYHCDAPAWSDSTAWWVKFGSDPTEIRTAYPLILQLGTQAFYHWATGTKVKVE